ncbi:hypothetical protein [Paenibacillus piscarius]|uniref:hypothetical protein n=1 Tax=Paenibacillus piscarius TaxID=1089681 RepID=UPI001EE88F5E|nr:hypothetical protein [Paenibacillus piscarius]
MKRRLQTMATPGVQEPSPFIQAILGKYGIRRWRRKLPGLILRPVLQPFEEPESGGTAAGTVIQHIHSAFYYPVTRIREAAGPVSRIQLVTQGGGAPGSSARNARTDSEGRLHRVLLPATERHRSLQAFQAEVRKRQGREDLITTVYSTLSAAGDKGQPPGASAVEANEARALAVHRPAGPPLPSRATAAGEHAERPGSGGTSAPVDLREQAYAARRQRQVLRTYSLPVETAGQDRPAARQPAAPAASAAPAAPAAKQGPPSGAAPDAARTAAELPPPAQGLRAGPMVQQAAAGSGPALRLVLAQQLAAALEQPPAAGIPEPPQARQGISHPLQPVAAASPLRLLPAQRMQALPAPLLRMRLPLGLPPSAAASPALARTGASARPAGAAPTAAPEERPAAAPEAGRVYTAARRPSPAAQPAGRHPGLRHSAGLVPEAELPPAGSASRLVLRKPEAPPAALPEPVQQQLQRMLQEPAPPPQILAAAKGLPAAAPMDAAELNRLAEQVYQVLEKRIAIRKDRRGLR